MRKSRTIRISEEVAEILEKLRDTWGLKSIDSVIKHLLIEKMIPTESIVAAIALAKIFTANLVKRLEVITYKNLAIVVAPPGAIMEGPEEIAMILSSRGKAIILRAKSLEQGLKIRIADKEYIVKKCEIQEVTIEK